MMRTLLTKLILCIVCVLSLAAFSASAQTNEAVTEKDIRLKFLNATALGQKINILIVPGHDDEYTGTAFKDYSEDDVTLEISNRLYELLSKEKAFNVYRTRTQMGYTPEFLTYFATERESVNEFVQARAENYAKDRESGAIQRLENQVFHNVAKPEVAFRLAAINKWANDKDMDMVLHLHVNDTGGRSWNKPGDHTGMTIYIPHRQFRNSEASRALATSLLHSINTLLPKSTHPGESAGIVEDQDLIAIGSNNSLESGSVLIEYGYIYEPQFATLPLRNAAARAYAENTYKGIMNFFGVEPKLASISTPITSDLVKGVEESPSVFSLQAALARNGFYPPDGDLSLCPLTGSFGSCTERAVKAFQKAKNLPQIGRVGPQTRSALLRLP